MRQIAFTDRDGRAWRMCEWRLENGKRIRVPLEHLPMGNARAEGRAFLPDGWAGEAMLYKFGGVAYRDVEPRTLQQQLDDAIRANATTTERVQHHYRK